MPTYELISSATVGSGGTTAINFTSIPQTFTDLVVKLSTRMSTQDYRSRYNGNAADYNCTFVYGDGSSAASFRSSVAGYIGITTPTANTANTFGNNEIYIPNYRVVELHQIGQFGVSENNATLAYIAATAQLWSNYSAITSIEITQYTGGTISEFSTAYLYGISNA